MYKNKIKEIKSHIVIYTNGLKIKKYKLDRNNSNVKYKVYTTYPTINNDYDIDTIKDKLSNQLLKYFNIFINKFPKNYLKTFFKNLSTIDYQEGLDKEGMLRSLLGIITGSGTTEGYYYGYENKIYVISKKQKKLLTFLTGNNSFSYDEIINNVLSHELFHAATYMTTDNIMFCGFYQNSGIYDIGNGINEGYTELLARRYFDKENGYYDDEVIIAALIEEIIGKDKMESLYFYADLKGLIKSLSAYTDESYVNRFIINFDKYCQKPDDKTLRDIFIFIMDINKNKVLKDSRIKDKEKQINEYNEKILSYIKEDNEKVIKR